MNKQMQKNGFKNYIVRGVVCFSLLALVLFGQVASASTISDIQSTATWANATANCSSLGGILPSYDPYYTTDSGIPDGSSFTSYWVSDYQYAEATFSLSPTRSLQTGSSGTENQYYCILSDSEPVVASFFSDTNAFDNLSTVTSDTFSGIVNWLYLILGVILAFFVIEKIITIIPQDRVSEEDKKFSDMITRGTAMKEKIDKLPE